MNRPHENFAARVRSSAHSGSFAQSLRLGFEEDDRLRSLYIRELTLSQLRGDVDSIEGSSGEVGQGIPRTLIQFWDDPRRVPPDVRTCMESWRSLEDEGFDVLVFGDDTAASFIADRYGSDEIEAFHRCHHPAMRSDYFRLCFMVANGGLYVDADDVLVSAGWTRVLADDRLKIHALAFDLAANAMMTDADVRRTDLPPDDRIFYVNNNPIAAPPGHAILRRALTRATQRLLEGGPATDIQSITGPGNLTAALAAHARERQVLGMPPDFELMVDWASIAEPRWDLSYRSGPRNWRNVKQY